MKWFSLLMAGWWLAAPAFGDVRVYVEDADGAAAIRYECTAGEVVRAFALDVSVDRGQIVGVTNYFRGQSRVGKTGYGIFPASFRDQLTVSSGTNVNWDVPAYSPLANPADAPGATLPGLNSSGVTLEFGALWDPSVPEAVPGPSGTLCVLRLSEPARVSIAPNTVRGGVVSVQAAGITSVFNGALVGPAINSFSFADGVVMLTFKGGELQSATSLDGPWTDTGNTSGEYSETIGPDAIRFFRVRALSAL